MKEELKWYFEHNPKYAHLKEHELRECFHDIDELFYTYQPERLNPEDVECNATAPCGYEEGMEPKFTFDICDSPNTANK